MVLPAPLADRVRGMTGDGGGTTVINITAMDGRDVERVLKRHQGALVRVLNDANRNGRKS